MKRKELTTTTKYYGRLEKALSNAALSKFTIRVLWDPPRVKATEKPVCPSSIAKYFSDLEYNVNLNQTECKTSIEYGLKMPILGRDCDDLVEVNGQQKFYATPHELTEYAGMLALGCNLEQTEYLNTWSFEGHTIDVGSALVVRFKGMFSCNLIKMIFRMLR